VLLQPPSAIIVVSRNWAWTLWRAAIPVPKDTTGGVKLICRAVDANYNTQPESPDGIWNLRGVLNNAWHEVSFYVE
jgi:sulfite oxidase